MIHIDELQPGDLVLLACPASRNRPQRTAVFERTINGDELLNDGMIALPGNFAVDLKARYAVFLFDEELLGAASLHGALRIRDGRLEDDHKRTIYVETRIARRGQG